MKPFFYGIIFCLANYVQAQDKPICTFKYLHDLEKGNAFAPEGSVLKNSDNQMFYVWQQFKPISVIKVDKNSVTDPVDTKLEYEGRQVKLLKAFYVNNKAIVIGECIKMKPLTDRLLAYELDQNTSQIIDHPVLLLEEPCGAVTPNYHKIRVHEGNDKDAFFSITTTKGAWGINKRFMRITMFDQGFEKQFDKTFDFEEMERSPQVENVLIKDPDNISIVAREYGNWQKKEEKKNRPDYTYHVFYCTEKGASVKDFEIKNRDVFIRDILTTITPDNKLLAVGFYSKTDAHDLAGLFRQTINGKSGEVEKTSLKEFDNKIVKMMVDKRNQSDLRKNKDGDLDAIPYSLDTLIPDGKNGYYLVAENFYINHFSKNSPKYHYDDLLVSYMDTAGEIKWISKVDKKMKFEGPVRTYCVFLQNDKLYILFNDSRGNLIDSEDKIADQNTKSFNAVPVIVSISGDGAQTKSAIGLPNGKNGYRMVPRFFIRSGNDSYVLLKDGGPMGYYKLIFE